MSGHVGTIDSPNAFAAVGVVAAFADFGFDVGAMLAVGSSYASAAVGIVADAAAVAVDRHCRHWPNAPFRLAELERRMVPEPTDLAEYCFDIVAAAADIGGFRGSVALESFV